MIETDTPSFHVNKNNLIELFHNRVLQQNLAAQIVASNVEGLMDMIADKITDEKGPNAPIHPSFNDVKHEMSKAKQCALDCIDDMLEDLRMLLVEDIARCEVSLRKLELSEDDFEADVEVKYAE